MWATRCSAEAQPIKAKRAVHAMVSARREWLVDHAMGEPAIKSAKHTEQQEDSATLGGQKNPRTSWNSAEKVTIDRRARMLSCEVEAASEVLTRGAWFCHWTQSKKKKTPSGGGKQATSGKKNTVLWAAAKREALAAKYLRLQAPGASGDGRSLGCATGQGCMGVTHNKWGKRSQGVGKKQQVGQTHRAGCWQRNTSGCRLWAGLAMADHDPGVGHLPHNICARKKMCGQKPCELRRDVNGQAHACLRIDLELSFILIKHGHHATSKQAT